MLSRFVSDQFKSDIASHAAFMRATPPTSRYLLLRHPMPKVTCSALHVAQHERIKIAETQQIVPLNPGTFDKIIPPRLVTVTYFP